MPRPKEFDPDNALEKAMQVFWRKGYETTSVQDLVEAMGINRFSLYDTFGDKHQLFLAALDRYRLKTAPERLHALEQSNEGLAGLRRYFRDVVDSAGMKEGRMGCLMANSAVELAPHDTQTAACVRAYLKWTEQVFYRALLRARQKGEIRKSRNLRDLARFLTSSTLGVSTLIKAGARRGELEGVLRTVFTALEKA